ncbi:39S ribosomal protein L42, mitochondrial [Lampris incognitus]|uniref:39S ribosomal protein L42, mitochondrial n=1 Tax=Lampris incognitus TaxID=2546036 RepID=UPI0024B59B7D|nr:39S ribosomal protein L42, mitochondrial [Lampris incognitus]
MASGYSYMLKSILIRFTNPAVLRRGQTCLVPAFQKSSVSGSSPADYNCQVEIGLTSDEKTIVCYHPPLDVPYELTLPIERPDPLTNPAETLDQVLKVHLSKEVLKNKEGPTIEELSKMFFTTKHRWYPRGQYHMRRINKNPPKDR